jgi:membrane protease YdiL (CAAX protease family)
MEEILFRGIIYRILEQWLGTKIALLIPALIFGIAHITNENATFLGLIGAALGGLLVSISYTYSKRLWLPISLHLGWNFGQIIFGSNLSGMDEFGIMLRASIEGPKFLVGTAFGVEDSILSLIFTLILFLLIFYKSIKNGLIVNPSWKS